MEADRIYYKLQREQQKLKKMSLGQTSTLEQSVIVDRLINEYYRVIAIERGQINHD